MKRIELIEFKKNLDALNLKGYNKFVLYSVDRTKAKIKEIEQEINMKDQERFSPEYSAYEMSRLEELKKYGKRDADDNIVITNNSVEIPDDKKEAFEKSIVELREKYKEAIDEFMKKTKELEIFINEVVSDVIIKFSFKHLPENMDSSEYSVLSHFIKESPEEIEAIV